MSAQGVLQAYTEAAGRLARAGVASPETEAWQLLEASTGRSRADLLIEQASLESQQQRQLGEWLARRELREPLQRILGRAHFYGLELQVSAGVLIPRPETERLVEIALELLRPVQRPLVIDVGSGSGAIALAIAHERPDARVVASDIDTAALELTTRNAQASGLTLEVISSDLLSEPSLARLATGASLIACNPPYLPSSDRAEVPPEVRWEPPSALYAGEDGLEAFHRLERQASELLRAGSYLVVELDPRNVDSAAVQADGWRWSEVQEDLAGRRRFLLLQR